MTKEIFRRYGLEKFAQGKAPKRRFFLRDKTKNNFVQEFDSLQERNAMAKTLLIQRIKIAHESEHKWQKLTFAQRQLLAHPWKVSPVWRCQKCGACRFTIRNPPRFGLFYSYYRENFGVRWRHYKRIPKCEPFEFMG